MNDKNILVIFVTTIHLLEEKNDLSELFLSHERCLGHIGNSYYLHLIYRMNIKDLKYELFFPFWHRTITLKTKH